MDGASGQCRRVLLLRWARARLSRRENAAAASLRGAGTVVFASDGGLLGQYHGWSFSAFEIQFPTCRLLPVEANGWRLAASRESFRRFCQGATRDSPAGTLC